MWSKFFRHSLLVTSLVALQHNVAHAASIYILESSPRNMGNAFSGTASSADDASTNYFNVAGLTQLDRPTLTVGGNIIMPDVDFRNTNSTAATGTPLQSPLTGPNDSVDKPIPVPNFYYGLPVNERVSVGLGLNVPFGLESDYDENWIGRYHATYSKLTAINFNPNIAFKVTDKLINASLELPDIVTLSASHGIGEHWQVAADIAWYGWDSIQAININRPNGQNVATLDLQYENTMRYSLGTSYSGFRKLILRTGVLYDESPVPNAETLTPRIPDDDRIWFTVGASYSLTKDITIDMSYAHLFVNRTRINNTQQGHTLTGELDPTVDVLSIGGSWRF